MAKKRATKKKGTQKKGEDSLTVLSPSDNARMRALDAIVSTKQTEVEMMRQSLAREWRVIQETYKLPTRYAWNRETGEVTPAPEEAS